MLNLKDLQTYKFKQLVATDKDKRLWAIATVRERTIRYVTEIYSREGPTEIDHGKDLKAAVEEYNRH